MNKHMYVIPSHRKIPSKNIEEYFCEVEYIKNNSNDELYLVFFEDRDDCINLNEIRRIKNKYSNNKVFYVNRESTKKVLDYIKEQLDLNILDIYESLYPKNKVNYGNIFNRIFIFAVLFGCDYIHRRDSDVRIDANKENKIYPSYIEYKFLGKSINNKKVFIVGGGYKGKYNLDIDSFIEDNNYDILKKLFLCMSIPENHLDDIINEEFLGNNEKFKNDQFDIDSKAYPECGNISLYDLHKYFPSSPQNYILGSDYFFLDISIHGKLSVTYHNRAVIHKHTVERKINFEKVKNYWLGFLLLVDSQIFYRSFYDNYLSKYDLNFYSDFNQIKSDMTKEMMLNYNFFANDNSNRLNKLEKTVEVLKKSKDNQIVNVVNDLENNLLDIIEITNKSLIEHIKLLDVWEKIVNKISIIKDSQYINDLIKEMEID